MRKRREDSRDVADRERAAREVRRFFAIALGSTAVIHGAIAASGLPFSLSLSSPVLLLYLLGIATPAAAAIGLSGLSSAGSFLRRALGSASLAGCAAGLVVQAGLIATAAFIAHASGRAGLPRLAVAGDFALLALGQIWSCSARSSVGAGTPCRASCDSSPRARPP